MKDGRLRGFGRGWAKHHLQARPGFAWLFGLCPRPRLPDPNPLFLHVTILPEPFNCLR